MPSAHEGGTAPVIVVMGVSASGKSSVAAGLSSALELPWIDADDLHPAANVAKMASGQPLDDDDRGPWLDRVGEELARGAAAGGIIVACSALRRTYRDRLRSAAPRVSFVHLTGSPDLLASRASARRDHFMPSTLLASQLALLEPLDGDEAGTEIDVAPSVADIIEKALGWMGRHGDQLGD